MVMSDDKKIEILQGKIDYIETLKGLDSSSSEFHKWKSSVIAIIDRFFGITKSHNFKTIRYSDDCLRQGKARIIIHNEAYLKGLSKGRGIIEAFIEEIEMFGNSSTKETLKPKVIVSSEQQQLEELILRAEDIKKLFKSDSMFGLNTLDGDKFRQWLADIKVLVLELKQSKVTESILQLVDSFNGWKDEKNFSQLCSELKSVAKNFNNYSKVEKMENKKTFDKVFIVHGHDGALKLEVASFIKSLDLTPVILHQQASRGMTIIEKIERYSDVSFGIVLYTPCDEGSVKGGNIKPRARQNVIFEHGYLIGKLGRGNVCALVSDSQIEKPNDISGVVYISKNDSWEIAIAKELKACGYNIDMNKLI